MATTQLIPNKFAIFSTEAKLDAAVTAGYLTNNTIAFCKEAGNELIWTHGTKFKCDLSREDVQSAVTALNATNSELPVNSNAIRTLLQSIALQEVDATTTGEAIVKVSQTNGVVSATKGDVAAAHVTYERVNTGTAQDPVYDTTETTVQGAISEIYQTVDSFMTSGGIIGVYDSNGTKVTTIAVDGTTYTFKQGTTEIASINIPKDMFLRSGEVVYGSYDTSTHTFTPAAAAADQSNAYIKLVIDDDTTAGGNENAIYIPASSLVTLYTHNNSSGAKVVVTVNNTNHTISATIGANTIAWGDLTTGSGSLQNKITAQKTTITEIAQTNPATKHITVTKTTGNESNGTGDNYVIAENDIASAAYVGTLPSSGTNATNVVDYVDEQISALETAVGGTNLWENGTGTNSTKTKAGNTTAAGANSISAGDHTATTNAAEAAFGVYNNSSTGASDSAKTIFSVGTGTSSSDKSNGLEVRMNGDIYLNYSSAYSKLQTILSNEIDWYEDLT